MAATHTIEDGCIDDGYGYRLHMRDGSTVTRKNWRHNRWSALSDARHMGLSAGAWKYEILIGDALIQSGVLVKGDR